MPSIADIRALHDLPVPELLFRAASVHRAHWNPEELQFCTLDSIKTGGCPEDCAYCPQAARYATGVRAEPVKEKERVLAAARAAKAAGSTRYCMGAAWREVREGEAFEQVLALVAEVAALGLEVCVTLGLVRTAQARRLKAAGATVYNHNLDTSRAFYPAVISTRSFDDRLATLRAVREAGLEVCTGGILGLGEQPEDRIQFLHELTLLDPPPESIPINQLVAVPGTPLAGTGPVPPMAFIRMIAAARILFPRSRIRLSAGRTAMSDELQALAFLAGANSLFTGPRLLTTPNPGASHDHRLLADLGMRVEKARNI